MEPGTGTQEQIDRLLEEAEQAYVRGDLIALRQHTGAVLAIQPDNQAAGNLLAAADRSLVRSPGRNRSAPGGWLDRPAPLLCAAVALAVAVIAIIPMWGELGGRPSALVRVATADPLAPLAQASDPHFALVPPAAHYDGAYYYAIARDPFGRGAAHRLIDAAAYRYGHPGYGWIVGLGSLGQARAIPLVMLALNVFLFAAGAGLVALLARNLGRSAWWGMLVALNPGLISAVTSDTTEPALTAVVILGVLLWLRRRRGAGLVLTMGCFVKELGVLVPVGLALFEIALLLRDDRLRALGARPALLDGIRALAEDHLRPIAVLAIGPLLLLLWWTYVRSQFGAWPAAAYGQSASGLAPLLGIADTLRREAQAILGPADAVQIGMGTLPLVVAVSVAFMLGLVRSLEVKTPFEAILLPIAILVLSYNWYLLEYPKDLLRNTAVPLIFLALVPLARPPRDGSKRPS